MTIPTRAHYVKRNELARVPRRWVYLDTEARMELVGTTQHQSWRLGVTAFQHRDNKGRKWTETETLTHHDSAAMWEQISSYTRPRSRTIVVAHNIGYDLRISRALFALPALGWRVDQMSVGGRNLTMTLRRDSSTLVLTDFMAWLPMSLAKVGLLLGMGKLDLPEWDDSEAAWVARCTRDVEILHAANRAMLDWVDRDDLGNWQKTGAGMAWANWRHQHYTHRVLVHDDEEARDAEIAALHTGRCEAYRHGTVEASKWTEWDLPLAYPRVALDTQLPVQLQGHVVSPSLDWLDRRSKGSRVLVRATVTTEAPVLPIKGPDGFLWPVGTFTGWWWESELALARAFGESVELHHAIVYRAAPALAQWAAWVIAVAEGRDGAYSPIERAAAKHWSRALIGRFGAKYPVWEDYSAAPEPGVELSTFYDSDQGISGRMLTLGDRSFLGTETRYVADANPAMMGAVMAECRVRLWHMLSVAGLDHTAYADTDSLITDKVGTERIARWVADGSGWGLRKKTRWNTLRIMGPRQLVVNGRHRIAGVPTMAIPNGENEWIGERWEGVETTLASQTPDIVVVRDATWRVKGVDHRRSHLPGGATAPLRVELPTSALGASQTG